MSWSLCRAQLRCASRRLCAAAVAAPLVVAVGVAVAAALPALALWAGARAARSLESAFALDPGLAHASALCACLGAALVGAMLTAIAPGPEALGSQLAAAPLRPLTGVLGLAVLPLGVATVALSVPAVLFLVPLTGAATPSALASLAASVALGACAAEAAIAVSRRALSGVPIAGAVAALAALDPSRGLAAAVRGHATVMSGLLAVAAVVVWVAAAVARPRARGGTTTVRVIARGPFGAAFVRFVRAHELRRHALVAVVATAVGAVLLRAVGMPAAVLVLPAAATGILGASILPLAAAGLDQRARWLLWSAPRTRRSLALTSVAAGLVAGSVVAIAAFAAAASAAQVVPASAAALAPLACVLFAAAVLAGAIVPWRVSRALEQLGSVAVLAVVAGALSFALARLAPVVHAESSAGAMLVASSVLAASVLAAAEIARRNA